MDAASKRLKREPIVPPIAPLCSPPRCSTVLSFLTSTLPSAIIGRLLSTIETGRSSPCPAFPSLLRGDIVPRGAAPPLLSVQAIVKLPEPLYEKPRRFHLFSPRPLFPPPALLATLRPVRAFTGDARNFVLCWVPRGTRHIHAAGTGAGVPTMIATGPSCNSDEDGRPAGTTHSCRRTLCSCLRPVCATRPSRMCFRGASAEECGAGSEETMGFAVPHVQSCIAHSVSYLSYSDLRGWAGHPKRL